MPRLLDRYVLREVVPPFLLGLLLVTFVLLMNQVLLLADLFIDKGVPWLQALRLLGLLVPSILVFALPMAVLMGVVGGLARLSADSEIVALRSAGVGPRRLARPLLVFGLCGFFLTLPLALSLAPRANNAWVRAMTDSVLARVRLKIEPLEFNETFPGTVLFVRDIGPDRSWRDVFAYMGRDPSQPRVVLARSGSVRLFPGERRAILELRDGRVYSGPLDEPGEDTVTTFERLEEEIDVAGLFASASNEKRVREKDIGELVRDLRSLEAARAPAGPESRQIRAHRIEIHKKLALPAACLVLALLGLPLGIMTGRAGRTGGFSLGLVIILLLLCAADGRGEGGHGRPDLRLPRHVGARHRSGRRRGLAHPRPGAGAPGSGPENSPSGRPVPGRRSVRRPPRPGRPAALCVRGPGPSVFPACSTGTSRESSWPSWPWSSRRSPPPPFWSRSSKVSATRSSTAIRSGSFSAMPGSRCPSSWPTSCPRPF